MTLGFKKNGTRNYLLEETKHDLMSRKHKKVCKALNYFEHFLVFVSALGNCVSIFVFASLFGVPAGIAISAVGLKICVIIPGIKKCKSIIKRKKKKLDKTVFLGKTKLRIIEVLISKALIDLYCNHDKLFSVTNVSREYNEMKEKIKNPENVMEYTIKSKWKCIVSVVREIMQTKILLLQIQNKID